MTARAEEDGGPVRWPQRCPDLRLEPRRRFHQVSLSGRIKISFYKIKEKPSDISLISLEGGGGVRIQSTPNYGFWEDYQCNMFSLAKTSDNNSNANISRGSVVAYGPAGQRICVPVSLCPTTLAIPN